MDTLKNAKGFTLIEVLIALVVVTVGLFSLLGVMAVAVQRASGGTFSVIAREKAREAIESVHTARDTGALSWPNIRNVSDGGLFRNGQLALGSPGADGLVNTADDGPVEKLRMPGNDGVLGNSDDTFIPLDNFTREIIINALPGNAGGTNPNLREIIVNVRYTARGIQRTYTLRTYVSSFS